MCLGANVAELLHMEWLYADYFLRGCLSMPAPYWILTHYWRRCGRRTSIGIRACHGHEHTIPQNAVSVVKKKPCIGPLRADWGSSHALQRVVATASTWGLTEKERKSSACHALLCWLLPGETTSTGRSGGLVCWLWMTWAVHCAAHDRTYVSQHLCVAYKSSVHTHASFPCWCREISLLVSG